MTSYFLFLFNFIVHYFYIFIFLEPQKYIKVLPGNINSRAISFANGKSIFFPDAWSSYYLFVGEIYKLLHILQLDSSGFKIYTIVTINVILSSISVVIIYLIAKKITSKSLALLISIIFIFYYPYLYLNSMIMSENVFIPALVGFSYLLLCKSKKIEWLWAGLLLGISLLSRPILFTFIPFLVIWLLLFKRKALVLFIPTIIILIIVGLINQKISTNHVFSIGSNGGVNFAMTQCQFKKLQYNGPNNERFNFKPPAFWNSNKEEKYTSVPFTNQGHYYKMGLSCLTKNPARLLTNFEYVKNIFLGKFYPDFPKNTLHKTQLTIWKFLSIVFYILFISYSFTRINNKSLPVYLLFLFLFTSLIVSVYFANPGEQRYLISYFFILIIFAIPTLSEIIKRVGLYKSIHWVKSKINHLIPVFIRKKEAS